MPESYKKFIDSCRYVPVMLWAIPSDKFLHPCVTDISLVFIKQTVNGETFCVSFNHPDLAPCVTKKELIDDLNTLTDKKWVIDKKIFLQLLPGVNDLLDFNLWKHLNTGSVIEEQLFETIAHKFIYRSKRNCGDLNKVVPLLKHKEVFEKISDIYFQTDTNLVDEGYKKENSIILETLTELESNGIYVNEDCFKQHFEAKINPNGLVYSQYNLYTSTGRPSNHFDGVNYAALNKDDGARSCFVSRYGDEGTMVLIDYSAFHPRIICNLVNFDMPIEEDIYKYLGKLYFHREVNEYDMEEIKSITMRQLYGGVEEQYESIKYFRNLKEFKDIYWNKFSEDGFVWTPIFRRLISTDHLKDGNKNKLFNYILQATETESSMTAVKVVNQYLKSKKTKAVLYTSDSLLFDFYKGDGTDTLEKIMMIMKMGNRFPIKAYMGDSYNTLTQIYP